MKRLLAMERAWIDGTLVEPGSVIFLEDAFAASRAFVPAPDDAAELERLRTELLESPRRVEFGLYKRAKQVKNKRLLDQLEIHAPQSPVAVHESSEQRERRVLDEQGENYAEPDA